MKPSTKGYTAFLLSNAPQIASLESAFRTLTYILPGRFSNADLIAEAIGASLNVASLYHDSILDPVAKRQMNTTPSNFNKYTAAMLNTSPVYARIAYVYTFMTFLDNLLEQALTRRFGMNVKWPFITTYEVIKLALRLALFRLSRLRMLPHQVVKAREYDPAKLKPQDLSSITSNNDSVTTNNIYSTSPTTGYVGSRSGKTFSTMEQVGRDPKAVGSFLEARALTEAVKNPSDLLQPLDNLRTLAELAFMLRPIIYVFMIQKYGTHSWKPWTTSLAMEFVSLAIQTNPWELTWRNDLTNLEKKEYQRRLLFLGYYILRNPFFNEYTRPRLQKLIDWGSQKMIISLVTGIMRDMIPMWENVYYLTAAY